MKFSAIILISITSALASWSYASADDAGKAEYMTYCATCHGENGDGLGPMAEFMSSKVPDLTLVSKSNDGVFPFLEIAQMVDGRATIGAHGREMPLWGERFMAEGGETLVGDYSRVHEVRGRVLSLALYLESIQR
ncbi:MAG: cytochrome c [Boseongicola sp.]|nr:cytochrome c [Boseongicola sp.]